MNDGGIGLNSDRLSIAEEVLLRGRQQATGELVFSKVDQQWSLYFFHGRLAYATGGAHRVRRWRRALNHCGVSDPWQVQQSLSEPWEYALLTWALQQGQLSMAQVRAVIHLGFWEVLFALLQEGATWQHWRLNRQLPCQLALLQPEPVVQEAVELHQTWTEAGLATLSPNLAPQLRQPERLQQQVTAAVYQNLVQWLDGQHTLWDISLQSHKSPVAIVQVLLPLIHREIVRLQGIPDLPVPVAIAVAPDPRPLLVCIDDSPLTGQTLTQLLTPPGYRVLSLTDPLQAIGQLLIHKPAMIFLDLVMPNMNGYELCAQLRKTSLLQETPIVILTSHNSFIDRVQARLCGATEFLAKPPDPEKVLAITRQYLPLPLAKAS